MAVRNQDTGLNAFQTFSTLLAVLLPVLQVFFNFLPSSAQNIFVFKDILVPVSVIAGIFSYLLIIAFRNTVWFSLAFNRKKHREYEAFQQQVNIHQAEPDELVRQYRLKELFKKPKKPPLYLTPHNVSILLIPALLLFTLIFLAIGIFGMDSHNNVLVLAQSISYILSVSLTSLTLAVFYINETNRQNSQRLSRDKYDKIIRLLFDNKSLPEFPKIEFVAQSDPDFNALRTYIRVNDKIVYEITTDPTGDILKQVLISPQPEDGQ